MRKKYSEFVIKFGGNKKPVAEDLIEWVISSQYEPNDISKDMIINPFKKTAISNKMDCTEEERRFKSKDLFLPFPSTIMELNILI